MWRWVMGNGLINGLHSISVWVMRFAVINLLWFVFNLPIIIISIPVIFSEQLSVFFLLLIPIFVLAPFLLFPSTAALFSSVREWLIDEDDHSSLVRGFIKFYKTNYKKSLLGGGLITSLWVIWSVDYYYFSKVNLTFMTIFLIMGILLFVFTINFFSVNAHYNLSLFSLIRNALILTVGSPVLTLTIIISSAFILYMSLYISQLVIPIFSVSLVAFISFSAFYRQYLKVKEQMD
jgi:uncharacterized membrane protein YesL